MSVSSMILRNLVHNEEYFRRVAPYVNSSYFETPYERLVHEMFTEFVMKYNSRPSIEAMEICLADRRGVPEKDYERTAELLVDMQTPPEKVDVQWAIDQTEQFCKDRSIYNAVMEAIEIIDGRSKKSLTTGAIPQILQDALAVSFDPNVGHNYIEDSDKRFEFYNTVEERLPLDVAMMNEITGGGLPKKTLNLLMAGIGVGKTLSMCSWAATHMMMGKNVLYVTAEMAEERIAERIDANLLDTPINELKSLTAIDYARRVARVRAKTIGKMIIKEYPTASVHSGHLRYLLNELNLKKGFVPDIIYIDYLNICASSRVKPGSNIGMYQYVKAIAEELRGLAVEYNVPIVTATQFNRIGYDSSDPDMTDTAESFGLPATADFIIALVTSEELEKLNQIMVKQLKNRYRDVAVSRKFVVGIDKSRMRLYDLDDAAQAGIQQDDVPVYDKTTVGNRQKRDFSGMQV